MQVTVQIDHVLSGKMLTNTLAVELPLDQTWANVKNWRLDGFSMKLEFDNGIKRENLNRGDDYEMYIYSPRKVWIRDETGNLLEERDIPGKARDDLIAALKEVGGTTAKIEYNGCGDEGWIECVTVFDQAGQVIMSVERPGGQVDETTKKGDPAVIERLKMLSYEVLGIFVGGWEDNEGGNGTINVDVNERKLILNHSQNVVKVEEEHYEV